MNLSNGQHVYTWCNVVGHPVVHVKVYERICKPGKEPSHKSASHQADRWRVHPRTWYCIAYESHTDGRSRRTRTLDLLKISLSLSDGSPHSEGGVLVIKCIIHAVVNSLCGLRSCLSCGTCTAFVCCTDTLRIQAITAQELESRFASEWETDHLPLS